jgi:signal transduction histidine kinase
MNIKFAFISVVLWILLPYVVLCSPTFGNSQNGELLLKNKIAVFEDASNVLPFDSILDQGISQRFSPIKKSIFNNPFSQNVHWFKFDSLNLSEDIWVLTLKQPIVGDIDFYYKNELNEWVKISNKVEDAWYEREIKYHLHSFELPLNSNQLYFRVHTRSNPISFELLKKSDFESHKTRRLILLSLMIGFMVYVILYNLFLFSTIRRLEYIIYCVLILGYLLFTMTITGFIQYLFIKNDLWLWFKWIPIFLQPVGMLYTLVFLSVRKYPKMYRIGIILIIYLVTYWFWNLALPNEYVFIISQINALLGMMMMMIIGVYVGMKGDRLGYYFSFAYVLMLTFGGLDVSHLNFGKPPYIMDLSYVTIGFLFEIVILSYLLTKRFEWENKEIIQSREEAQKRLVQTTLENERIVKNQNVILEDLVNQRTQELTKSLDNLKIAQAQLIQAEKMASLGELTAGIAHEIQNPLNFVNNFSEVSAELIEEMNEELDNGDIQEAKNIASDIKSNLEKITHHGKRADGIVKGMLQHSRNRTSQKELTDLNVLCEEYLKLAYHGLRAKDKSFNATLNTDFDPSVPKVNIVQQDIGRVVLNIITNAFHAVRERSMNEVSDYKPEVKVRTQLGNDSITISIQDNGGGISDTIKEKIFQPFFTTKPTGQGTGLGLSMAYDIVQAHGGKLNMESKINQGTTFYISLPLSHSDTLKT